MPVIQIKKAKKLDFDERTNVKPQNFSALKFAFCFEAFGVGFIIRAERLQDVELIKKNLETILPTGWREREADGTEHIFSITVEKENGSGASFYKNGKLKDKNVSTEILLESIGRQIRLTIAEFTSEFVFLHAGAVVWKGKAVIIPGRSLAGKTSLTVEFVKRGAVYFSDEYAVIDKQGLLRPFPKKLSVRGILEENRQVDVEVEELGGRRGTIPFPIGLIIFAEYKQNAKPGLKRLSAGEGMLAALANSLSIRQNPKFVLEVLNKILKDALILHSQRGEAKEFVDTLLNFVED